MSSESSHRCDSRADHTAQQTATVTATVTAVSTEVEWKTQVDYLTPIVSTIKANLPFQTETETDTVTSTEVEWVGLGATVGRRGLSTNHPSQKTSTEWETATVTAPPVTVTAQCTTAWGGQKTNTWS